MIARNLQVALYRIERSATMAATGFLAPEFLALAATLPRLLMVGLILRACCEVESGLKFMATPIEIMLRQFRKAWKKPPGLLPLKPTQIGAGPASIVEPPHVDYSGHAHVSVPISGKPEIGCKGRICNAQTRRSAPITSAACCVRPR